MRAEEIEILREARNWGLGRDLGVSATDMHMLAVLQHHGVPTRLFDVTANPMTALWFATQDGKPDEDGRKPITEGVVFAIDVTDSPWYETFQHAETKTWADVGEPLTAPWERALEASSSGSKFFRAFPALPDERMKAQEGFFLGSAFPDKHVTPGVVGLNPLSLVAPGPTRLGKLLNMEQRGRGRPARVPFIAIVIPPEVKDKVRLPLKPTFNRHPRVMFPDVDGFRSAFETGQLD